MMDLNDPKTWLGSVLAVLASLFAWSAKRQMEGFDKDQVETLKQLEAHSTRLRQLEMEVARRSDIDHLHQQISTLSDRMNAQHVQILNALVKRE
jgi:hypothetical protein